MMNNRLFKPVLLFLLFASCAAVTGFVSCNERSGTASGNDTLPGVVQPPVTDTSAVKRTPPVYDSNVINPDSMGISR